MTKAKKTREKHPADESGHKGKRQSHDDAWPEDASLPESAQRPAWQRAAAWAGFVGAYAGAQVISMHFTGDAVTKTRRLRKPPFAPPTAAYPIAWTALNALTATSAWLVWDRGHADDANRRTALTLFAASALPRTAYNPLFFAAEQRWAATADAVVLAATMSSYAVVAGRVDRLAGMLALPEAAWTSFASVLSGEIARRNE